MKPGHIWLAQGHQILPGIVLSSVSMARQLQVVTGRRGLENAFGLMCKQDARMMVIRTLEGPGRRRSVARVEPSGVKIVYTGHQEPSCSPVYNAVFIFKDDESQSADRLNPKPDARVVLVVSGDEIDPQGCGKAG